MRVCSSCPQGLIQLCHNTTPKQFGIQISQNNLQRKLRFVLIEGAWLQSQYIVKNIQSHGQEKKGRYRVKLTFSASPVRGEDRELNAELTSLTKPSCHKFYQRAQVNKKSLLCESPWYWNSPILFNVYCLFLNWRKFGVEKFDKVFALVVLVVISSYSRMSKLSESNQAKQFEPKFTRYLFSATKIELLNVSFNLKSPTLMP